MNLIEIGKRPEIQPIETADQMKNSETITESLTQPLQTPEESPIKLKVERDILVQSFEKAKEFMRTQKKQIQTLEEEKQTIFQKYMEDLTDMQNHVLPYLQSFCNLDEKGVKERREQQIAERYEGRADERVTSTEANAVVKDVGKTDRKPAQQKRAVDEKDKKLSIHERLEINKRIIQEKQGKDKPERGADRGVR